VEIQAQCGYVGIEKGSDKLARKEYICEMKWLRKFMFLIALWMFFTLGCVCAPILALLLAVPYFWRCKYMQNFVKAVDRMCAAELGFSGRAMLSTELVFTSRLGWVRRGLDECEENHCLKSVYVEGPYCRLSDREIRAK
jgi:hypothetical protein